MKILEFSVYEDKTVISSDSFETTILEESEYSQEITDAVDNLKTMVSSHATNDLGEAVTEEDILRLSYSRSSVRNSDFEDIVVANIPDIYLEEQYVIVKTADESISESVDALNLLYETYITSLLPVAE